jgi:plastocyanin
MSKTSSNTAIAGIIVTVFIVAAVASIGYYQFNFAKPPDTNTSTTAGVSCIPKSCVLVNITAGAGAGPAGAPGYSPDVITVVIGVNNTVQWTNQDVAVHSVTATNSTFSSAAGGMNSGDTYVYQFTSPGTFPYHCVYHAWMSGMVIVKAGNGTTTSAA